MISNYKEIPVTRYGVASKVLLALVAAILTLAASITTFASPAEAKLSQVGPINPDNGYPYWYQDENGTRLDLCLDNSAASKCLKPFEMPEPDGVVSFPNNFPGESFWWTGEASTTIDNGTPTGADALLVTALEAAFANEEVVDGDQMSFGRVRIRIDGLEAGQQYRVSHPFGTKLFTAEPVVAGSSVGEINTTEDIGCFPTPQTKCDFGEALSGKPGPFLQWTEGAPDGYLGDPDVPHAVTGSVVDSDPNTEGVQAQNFFKIEKVNADGTFSQIGFTDQFAITGKLAKLQVGATPRDSLSNDPNQQVELIASDPAAETQIYYTDNDDNDPATTENSDPADPANPDRKLYEGPITLPSELGAVTDTTLKFVAIKGDQSSEVVTKTYTVDRLAPHLTADPGSGVFEDTQNVHLNTNEPANIYYTTDGSSPVGASDQITGTKYDGTAIELKRSARINAVAVDTDENGDEIGNRSRIETFSYDIASVAKTGPTNPQGGYPFWYQDKNGVKLDLCLDNSAATKCLAPFEMPEPDGTMSFPENFPGESFWWTGEASVDRPGAKRTLLVMAMEAAFANDEVVDGDQMSFGRIRIRLDALDAGSQYRITHPYGVDTFTAEPSPKGGGEINVTEDIGCFPTPTTKCNFNDARFGRVGPFLTWTDFGNGTDTDPTTVSNPALADAAGNPDRYVGDPNVEHAVTGSPYDTNYFKVEKLDANGNVVGDPIAETNQFAVSGKVAEFQAGVNRKGGSFNKAQDIILGASEEGSEIYYSTNGDEPGVVNPDTGEISGTLYTGQFTIDRDTTLKFRALGPVPADGSPRAVSPLYTETYVIDTTAPTVTATPGGGTFENDPPSVTLEANEPAKIYFTKTTDGSEPPAPVPGNANTTLYSAPIQITTDTKLKFMAIDTAGNQSADVTETYTIIDTIAPGKPTIDLDAASDSGVSSTDNTTNDTTLALSGSAEAGSTVDILDGTTKVGSATAAQDNTYTVTTDALGQGAHSLTATATDAARPNPNTSVPSDALNVTVDTAAPVAKAPAQNFLVQQLALRTVPVRVSWAAATDTGGSGVVQYQLQQSANGGAFANVALPSATARSIDRNLAPNTYRFQARATDKAGNVSSFAAGPSVALTASRETSAAITYAGTWTRQNMNTALNGSTRFATAAGARATFRFTGNKVAWIAPKTANSGRAEVWIDGTRVATLSLYSATTQPRMPVFVRNNLSAGTHRLQIRVLGTKQAASGGTRVHVDGFMVMR